MFEPQDCEVVSIDERKFKVHKKILAAESSYFQCVIECEHEKSEDRSVLLPFPADVVETILLTCYGAGVEIRSLTNRSTDDLISIYTCARYVGLKEPFFTIFGDVCQSRDASSDDLDRLMETAKNHRDVALFETLAERSPGAYFPELKSGSQVVCDNGCGCLYPATIGSTSNFPLFTVHFNDFSNKYDRYCSFRHLIVKFQIRPFSDACPDPHFVVVPSKRDPLLWRRVDVIQTLVDGDEQLVVVRRKTQSANKLPEICKPKALHLLVPEVPWYFGTAPNEVKNSQHSGKRKMPDAEAGGKNEVQ